MYGPWEATTGPINCLIVASSKYIFICSPGSHRVDLSQSRFSQDKIIFVQRIENGVEVVKVVVTM